MTTDAEFAASSNETSELWKISSLRPRVGQNKNSFVASTTSRGSAFETYVFRTEFTFISPQSSPRKR